MVCQSLCLECLLPFCNETLCLFADGSGVNVLSGNTNTCVGRVNGQTVVVPVHGNDRGRVKYCYFGQIVFLIILSANKFH